jgi:PAS domain S-box-containing protein
MNTGFPLRRSILPCLIPLIVSVSVLAGWVSGELIIASFYPGWKAMAPFTAVILILASLSILISLRTGHGNIPLFSGAAVICCLIAVSLADRSGLAFAGLEKSLVPETSRAHLGSVNTGVMSTLTIGIFILISGGLIAAGLRGRKYSGPITAFTGILTFCAGVIDISGYLTGNRILQGMISFPTGLCFLSIGSALVLEADRNSFPARIFMGRRTSSIILRRMIPLVLAAIFIQGAVLNLFSGASMDSMYVLAIFTAALVVLVLAVSARVSVSLGRIIERLTDEREAARTGYAESERRYETLVESLQEGIAVLDENGVIQYANPRMCEFFVSGKPVVGEVFDACVESVNGIERGKFREYISEGVIINGECAIKGDADRIFYTMLTIVPFGDRNKFSGAIAGVVDITAKKRTEEELKESLENREILLRELYHRTKNNMQVICAMIRLRMSDVPDEKSRMYFRELDSRILAMSLVHQKLYESKNLSIIDIEDYTRDLAGQLSRNLSGERLKIEFVIDIDEILLPIENANPYGLLITELITNSYKHAFPDADSGRIFIGIRPSGLSHLRLAYSDNGRGLPRDFSLDRLNTFGFRIIKNLSENQMNGVLRILDEPGFSVEVVFPRDCRGSNPVPDGGRGN